MVSLTLLQVIPMAVAAEKTIACLYLGLAARFAAYPNIAVLWEKFGQEEGEHARWLEQYCDRMPLDTLNQPVDPHTVESIQAVAGFSVDQAIENVRSLDEALALIQKIDDPEAHSFFSLVYALRYKTITTLAARHKSLTSSARQDQAALRASHQAPLNQSGGESLLG